ncbi:hypothetical protein BJ508DRAFT_308725 [Ascobolus immersus RN42]|uniref:Uncharacterized protein n=1 Tax=Ascobolus immersus RN42 TaxID=1160509 RepID=A0A3N4HYP5_ASCIM|nr:hypothetical protein BJ508DRAFT_308725 [Ascobolus immersus RN42]
MAASNIIPDNDPRDLATIEFQLRYRNTFVDTEENLCKTAEGGDKEGWCTPDRTVLNAALVGEDQFLGHQKMNHSTTTACQTAGPLINHEVSMFQGFKFRDPDVHIKSRSHDSNQIQHPTIITQRSIYYNEALAARIQTIRHIAIMRSSPATDLLLLGLLAFARIQNVSSAPAPLSKPDANHPANPLTFEYGGHIFRECAKRPPFTSENSICKETYRLRKEETCEKKYANYVTEMTNKYGTYQGSNYIKAANLVDGKDTCEGAKEGTEICTNRSFTEGFETAIKALEKVDRQCCVYRSKKGFPTDTGGYREIKTPYPGCENLD